MQKSFSFLNLRQVIRFLSEFITKFMLLLFWHATNAKLAHSLIQYDSQCTVLKLAASRIIGAFGGFLVLEDYQHVVSFLFILNKVIKGK